MENKLVTLYEVNRIISDNYFDKRRVFTTGVFDVPHIGHPRYLAEAKKQGDILIVGIHSDGLVKERKGPDRPVYSEKERMEFLSYYSSVDFVLKLEDQNMVYETIRKLRASILVVSETTEDVDNCPSTMINLFSSFMEVIVLGAQSEHHSTDVIKIPKEEFTSK